MPFLFSASRSLPLGESRSSKIISKLLNSRSTKDIYITGSDDPQCWRYIFKLFIRYFFSGDLLYLAKARWSYPRSCTLKARSKTKRSSRLDKRLLLLEPHVSSEAPLEQDSCIHIYKPSTCPLSVLAKNASGVGGCVFCLANFQALPKTNAKGWRAKPQVCTRW